MKHALVVAVAVVYVVVSLADGGYPPEAIAAGTLLIWWAVIVGLAVGALPRSGIPRPGIAAGLCILGLGLLTGLSFGWSSDDGLTFIELVRALGYAGLFVLVVLASPAGSARTWLAGLAIGLVAVAALALGSRLEPGLPGGQDEIGRFIPGSEGRLSYPIGYWNGLGSCMALVSVLLVWLGARAETGLARALAIGALPGVLLALYLTSSRGATIAAAIGLVVLMALGPERLRLAGGAALGLAGGAALVGLAELRSPLIDDPGTTVAHNAGDEILLATLIVCALVGVARHLADRPLAESRRVAFPRFATRIALVVVAFLALGAVAVADPVARYEEFKSEPEGSDVDQHLASGSGSGRYQFWSAAWDAFEEEPITGIGAGGYEAWWNQHGSIVRILRNAHSLFFETLAELGPGGLLLILSFLAIGAVYGWRRRAGGSPGGATEVALALLAAGVFSAATDWTWELPAVFAPVVVAVALLTGPATLRREDDPVPPGADRAALNPPTDRSFGWGVATLLTGWVAVWVAGLLFLTEIKLDDSRAAVDRGDLAAAAQDATDASTLQPWAAEPRLQLALVGEQARDWTVARAEIAEAIDRAPEDWSLWYAAARIEYKVGDLDAYEQAYERARELNPRAPIFTGGGGARGATPLPPPARARAEAQDQAPSDSPETPW
jgi:tetratricopeptide (TPR) repeat protein